MKHMPYHIFISVLISRFFKESGAAGQEEGLRVGPSLDPKHLQPPVLECLILSWSDRGGYIGQMAFRGQPHPESTLGT